MNKGETKGYQKEGNPVFPIIVCVKKGTVRTQAGFKNETYWPDRYRLVKKFDIL